MLHIYLPGNSPKNISELESISSALEKQGYEVYANHWSHWVEGGNLKLEKELKEISENVDFEDQEFGIIGKSIGTRVAMHLINEFNLKPKYILLMGLPVGRASEETRQLYHGVLENLDCPIYIMQNESDMVANIETVRKFMKGVDYTEIVQPGGGHRYNYPDEVLEIVKGVQ